MYRVRDGIHVRVCVYTNENMFVYIDNITQYNGVVKGLTSHYVYITMHLSRITLAECSRRKMFSNIHGI